SPSAVAPTAAPLSAAMIGPAAMNGPRPGIARVPMPASHPRTPPRTPPDTAPVVAPSGAFVCCSCAKSRVPSLSGNSTEMSLPVNRAVRRSSTIRVAWLSDFAMQMTDFFAMDPPSVVLDLELIVDALHAREVLGLRDDRRALGLALHRSAKRHDAIV